MPRRSWTSNVPRVYDVLMAPIEALGLGRMRAALWASVPPNGRGLEIGVGPGAGRRFRPPRADLIASDIAPDTLVRARASGDATPFVAADVQVLPFRDGTFDWVTGALLFCEVPDPARGLAEVRRVLRPGGTLHLLEHVRPHGLAGHAAAAVTRFTAPLFGEHFDRRTAERVLAAGFAIESLDRRLRGALVRLVARRTENAEGVR